MRPSFQVIVGIQAGFLFKALCGLMTAARKLEQMTFPSMAPVQGDWMEKPSLDEVLSYGKKMVRHWIRKKAKNAPLEQQEEMEQEAFIRLMTKYPEIETEKGWKSLVYQHCRGAVLDYDKGGHGFEDDSWSIQKPEEAGAVHAGKMQTRVSLNDSDGDDVSIEQVLGQNGAFSMFDPQKVSINWELVARLASQDEFLHAFAKFLRGVTLEEMAPVFGVKVARAGQLVQAFVARFDDPEHADCPWFKQTCFALGISEHLGMGLADQSGVRIGGLEFASLGWNLNPVDLDDNSPSQAIRETQSQMSFMDAAEA